MEVTTIQLIWFSLIGIIFALYAILDGFDLGVGICYVFAKSEEERKIMKNSIGPVWDGNEVWLIAGGGGLFAAFPLAYGTLFSSLYLAVMILIWSLILRAVSFEFRDQFNFKIWKKIWDGAFILGSFLPALLLGVALGNILTGLNLNSSQNYAGTFIDLLNPFSLITGIFVVFFFTNHGILYLLARTEQSLHEKAKHWFFYSWIILFLIFVVVNITILFSQSQLLKNYNENLIYWIFPFFSLLGILLLKYLVQEERYWLSFISSGITIIVLFTTVGIAIYPNLIPAINMTNSVSINAVASSEKTLTIMLTVALVGIPIILLYTFWIYKIFILKKISREIEYH